MKIITKTLLLTIILIFFPLKSFAHVEHYEKVEKFLMEIFKDGKKLVLTIIHLVGMIKIWK